MTHLSPDRLTQMIHDFMIGEARVKLPGLQSQIKLFRQLDAKQAAPWRRGVDALLVSLGFPEDMDVDAEISFTAIVGDPQEIASVPDDDEPPEEGMSGYVDQDHEPAPDPDAED